MQRPASAQEVAELLAEGRVTRPVGGRTKLDWGSPGSPAELELSTERLDAVVEHNAGDLTAVLQAGARLADAQAVFARAGQRLALDPPDLGARATIGGVVATSDSGPLRHHYGGVRELVIGVQVALADGTVARAGSRVIKNVAGYDLAKLMCGSFGTLGVICEVIVRLHPQPVDPVTVLAHGADPRELTRAAGTLRRLPLELEALDVRWDGRQGALLAQVAGRAARANAQAIAGQLGDLEVEIVAEDHTLWEDQRARQRAAADQQAVARVSFAPAELERVLRASPSAVARAGAGMAWVSLEPSPEALAALRTAVSPWPCVLLDGPEALRSTVDVWGLAEGPELALMRRVKARFDPGGICNRGRFAGGM